MPDTPFDHAAAEFLAQESAALPDLSRCTILLPHLHAAAPLLSALRRQIDRPVFLPPRLSTLGGLAAAVVLDSPFEADSLRLAEIRDFLASSGLCRERALWPAARELMALLAELSASRLDPTEDPAAFLQQVRSAYGGRLSRVLELEARLVLDLWQAMQQGRANDPARDYALRLAVAARQAPGPLCTLGLQSLSGVERGFLALWAERHPVRALPWKAAMAGRLALLEAAWPAPPAKGAPLPERARNIAKHIPTSPMRPDVSLYAASGLEDEARAAAEQIVAWAAGGGPRIAVIALDRLAARRLRALLERDRILIQDETGWTFATASVAHVLDRLFALLQDDCYHLDLLDLLKSPFVFADLDATHRQAAISGLERAIRKEGVVAGWGHFQQLARQSAAESVPLLARLDAARGHLWVGRRRTLADWQAALLRALQVLGAEAALRADSAGQQLLRLLEDLAAEVTNHPVKYTFEAWRDWLTLQLDEGSFRDAGIDSPIRLVSPAGARMRDFDGAILLGADAAHLPPVIATGLFNDRVRAELGLQGTAEQHADLRATLVDLFCHIPRLLITWQARLEGEPNPLSPWLEVLEGFHRLAYGAPLKRESADLAVATDFPAHPTPRPRPCPARLPGHLSASAWQSLVDCPYQHFARHILKLAELEEVPEEMEKRDYGELVHAILHRFHASHPRLSDSDPEALAQDLAGIGHSLFAPHIEKSHLALAWLLRWERRLPEYIAWACAREARGYRWREGEVRFSQDLVLPGEQHITLHGRLDRVDEGPGGLAVLDYKTRSRQDLRKRMSRPGEDVQLPFYALLTGASEAAYVTLDDDRPGELHLGGDLQEAGRREADRLRATLDGILRGAAMPALGSDPICGHCEMRGLCRRDYWQDDRPDCGPGAA